MSIAIQQNLETGVYSLILNRVDKKNAITSSMYATLAEALESANDNAQVRTILLLAEGDLFSGGNDIGEFFEIAKGTFKGEWQVFRFVKALARLRKPLVAGVQGRAVGIGTTMLLHCDYVVLAEDAVLSVPFVNLAMAPEAGSSLLLPALIGHRRAFSMFAFGDTILASTALNWGIANMVVPTPLLRVSANSAAQELAKKPLGSLMATKALLRNKEALVAQIDKEEAEIWARLRSAEANEAFSAFIEKRRPNFDRT